ncbi:Transcription factor AP-4 [Penaeus vannamei]|uniref:Transcription factor AP-4 n=1 Tax=Penaeus vannamei TaxID=6689 RepID=A0A3R7QUX2_PENVA|nr:Transcription factor AP-4 [Penaeus vannamei]
MTMFPRVGEKRRIDDIAIEDEEAIGSLCRLGGRPVSPKSAMEQEKRIRREIANSNERRRMQSINAGFASLKTLLPHHEGEKLSKAAILQQTAEYIYQLEQEKTRLLSQNCQLKRLLNQQQHHADAEGSPTGGESPCDDGGSSGGEPVVVSTPVDNGAATEELRREMIDLRVQLDRERRHRMSLEEQIRSLEAQTYPERIKEIPHVKQEVHESKSEQSTVTAPAQAPGNVIGTVVGQVAGQRQPTTAALNRQTVSHSPQNQLPTTVVSASPATTIVTVVPTSKGGVESLPCSVFEALTASGRFGAKVEVEPAPRVPSPEATIEYVEDNKNHTVYIVNSTNAACQKSLDTICEAIRHLEGDHMFQTEEQHPRIEEEIITEETLTIEDHTGDQVTFGGTQVPVTIGGQVTLGEQVTLGSGQVTLAGEDEPITLHMVGEPQEVPLELTTTHRPSQHGSSISNVSRLPQQSTISLTTNSRVAQHTSGNSSSHSSNSRLPQQSPSHTTTFEAVPVCSISTTTSSLTSHSSSLLQASRPGVIVVKHP